MVDKISNVVTIVNIGEISGVAFVKSRYSVQHSLVYDKSFVHLSKYPIFDILISAVLC